MTKAKKNQLGAFALCVYLGMFGVHRFYLGKIWTGVLQVLFTISLFGVFVTMIWVIVDAIRIGFGDLN